MALTILCFIAGAAFIAAGTYFLTSGFVKKLNEATAEKSPENLKRNLLRAKLTGYVALGLGALTLVWGFLLLLFPQIQAVLALIYMFLLLGAVTILMILMK